MKRAAVVSLLVGLPVVALTYWIAANTYWADTTVPLPLEGEARINPFYAVQRFAEALGAQTSWDRAFAVPPADAVVVLSAWHWTLSTSRRERLQRWVEAGGRLVVDESLTDASGGFERWSGIMREYREVEDVSKIMEDASKEPCARFAEEHAGTSSAVSDAPRYWLCDFSRFSWLSTTKRPLWALRDAAGIQRCAYRSVEAPSR